MPSWKVQEHMKFSKPAGCFDLKKHSLSGGFLFAGLHLHQVQIHERLLEGPFKKVDLLKHLVKLKKSNVSCLAAGFSHRQAGIPMAPTIFAFKGQRTPAKLLKEIKDGAV